MKFKVGDRVRIRTDLKIFEKYGSQYFVRDMKQHEGKIAIITRVFDDYYFINLDSFYWTDEMLKPCDAVLTISQLQSEIDKLSNKVQKEYSNVISNRDKVNYLKEQLKQLLEEYTSTLESAGYTQDSVTQKFWTSEEQTKELKKEYKNASKALDELGGSSDLSKEKLAQLTGAMAAVPNKKTIQVDADTSSARSKLNNLFSKLKTSGLSAFGSAAIGLVSSLPKLEKGGIANNPGRGVDVTFAENGAEMILPLENNTEWMDTLADKIASRTGGDRPLNIKATGSLSQLIRLLKLELDKEDDRRGGSMIKGGTL